jgi:hypothetical protein
MQTLKDVLRSHMRNENSSENLRDRVTRRPLFSIHEAFLACDKNGNSFVTRDEVRLNFLKF